MNKLITSLFVTFFCVITTLSYGQIKF
jgi:hypothetical protein